MKAKVKQSEVLAWLAQANAKPMPLYRVEIAPWTKKELDDGIRFWVELYAPRSRDAARIVKRYIDGCVFGAKKVKDNEGPET
jgi:hypothetical protein